MVSVSLHADVFVIGGGPVGLATAIAARRKGMNVVLADARTPPIDKACGEGMLPDGLPGARALGLNLPLEDCYPIRGIRFISGASSVEADFPQGNGYGVRRTTLHRELVNIATDAGVELRWGTSIADLKTILANWIVGADGMSSRVRTLAGLNLNNRESRRYGFRRHYSVAPWADYVEIYWGPRCQIYVTPVTSDQVGVALLSSDAKLRVDDALQYFPDLQRRLRGATHTSTERGAVTLMRKLNRVTRNNVALVGDASGSVDAITGEGLCLGFRQSLALADAMAVGNLNQYAAAHRSMARRPRMMAHLLLSLDRWPAIRKGVLPLLAAQPKVFASLLSLHVGAAH
jgi:flavin-dependent dehydrogenase